MKRRRTNQDYNDLASDYGFEWIGDMPRNVDSKTLWRCKNHHEWSATYHSIHGSSGCPYCSGNAPLVLQSYHDLAKDRGFEWIGKMPKNSKAKTLWRCPNGHEWEARYRDLKDGNGCPNCNHDTMRKSVQSYHDLARTSGFEWVGPIVNRSDIKTGWRCPKGHGWIASYNHLRGCSECWIFKGPARIAEDLSAMGIYFETEKRFPTCRHKNELPFDFYVPVANLLIEYQGEHHFKSIKGWGGRFKFNKIKRNDKIKADWAQESPYELLLINHDEYDRIAEILADRLQDYANSEYYKQARLL